MANDQVREILVKTAKYIDSLTKENQELRERVAKLEVFHRSGTQFNKLSEMTGLDVNDVYNRVKTMTPDQRQIIEKLAENDFSLGEPSDKVQVKTAEEAFAEWALS